MRVLLIEDDLMVGRSLARALDDAGLSVDWVTDGAAGSEALAVGGHGVALLDLGLPKLDGFEVLRQARGNGVKTPIVILTARDDLDTRVTGLDLGADDYVLKPFEMPELLARLRAVVRRQTGQTTSLLESGDIRLDLASHTVTFRDKSAFLPAREFALLRALAERPGVILSRQQLEDRLYGWGEEVESNAIDVLIHYVRKRFDKDIIRNVRGAGWMVVKN